MAWKPNARQAASVLQVLLHGPPSSHAPPRPRFVIVAAVSVAIHRQRQAHRTTVGAHAWLGAALAGRSLVLTQRELAKLFLAARGHVVFAKALGLVARDQCRHRSLRIETPPRPPSPSKVGGRGERTGAGFRGRGGGESGGHPLPWHAAPQQKPTTEGAPMTEIDERLASLESDLAALMMFCQVMARELPPDVAKRVGARLAKNLEGLEQQQALDLTLQGRLRSLGALLQALGRAADPDSHKTMQ